MDFFKIFERMSKKKTPKSQKHNGKQNTINYIVNTFNLTSKNFDGKNENSKEIIDELENKINILKKDKNNLLNKINSLNLKLDKINKENLILKSEIKNLHEELSLIKNQNNSLTKHREKLIRLLTTKNKIINNNSEYLDNSNTSEKKSSSLNQLNKIKFEESIIEDDSKLSASCIITGGNYIETLKEDSYLKTNSNNSLSLIPVYILNKQEEKNYKDIKIPKLNFNNIYNCKTKKNARIKNKQSDNTHEKKINNNNIKKENEMQLNKLFFNSYNKLAFINIDSSFKIKKNFVKDKNLN